MHAERESRGKINEKVANKNSGRGNTKESKIKIITFNKFEPKVLGFSL